MTTPKEASILANVLDNARQMTNFYLQNTSDIDKEKEFQINDFSTCNIHWIIAHLAWAEHFLILRGIGNIERNVDWLEHFSIGKDYPTTEQFPSYEETVETFNKVHQQAMELLRNMPEEALDEPNHIELTFGTDNSKRVLISHCIRHEGTHCGHIGWLIRMHGKKVI